MENRNFTLDQFKQSLNVMVTSNDIMSNGPVNERTIKVKEYSKEEIENIIDSGSLEEKITLSRNYYYKDGFYKRIILYYATLLKYSGILIPNPTTFGQDLSNQALQKRYYNAVNYLDIINPSLNCCNWSLIALRDGSYYGVVSAADKKHFALLDLPTKYCRSRFKDLNGNKIVEFNVQYFDTLILEEDRNLVLNSYPKFIADFYRNWVSKNRDYDKRWCLIPSQMGFCFQLLDGLPLFLNTIPATVDYDKAVETERERDLEEIRKIIVQQIPHLSDGGLLFEPEEAAEMHKGAVNMMKKNPNISVLTTYADVEGIVSKTSSDAANNTLEKMEQNIYANSGVTGQVFASNSNLALETSIKNDTALMMMLARQYDNLIGFIINDLYANGSINFKYMTLPITWYNDEKYADSAFKLASSGYSFLIPAIAMGLNQKDLGNIKTLENDVLKLAEKLVPLTSAYTQSGNVGRPELPAEQKSEKTIANEKSLDQGGSN